MMIKYTNSNYFNVLQLLIIISCCGMGTALAESDIDKLKHYFKLREKTILEVLELRKTSKENVQGVRRKVLAKLEKIHNKYFAQGKKNEANVTLREINKLRIKLELSKLSSSKDLVFSSANKNHAKINKYFKYQTKYYFDAVGKIRGKFIFMPNHKVEAQYHYNGENKTEHFDWKDMGDHIQIFAKNDLGTIIITERPKSRRKSLIIRWGGKLKNLLTDANIK